MEGANEYHHSRFTNTFQPGTLPSLILLGIVCLQANAWVYQECKVVERSLTEPEKDLRFQHHSLEVAIDGGDLPWRSSSDYLHQGETATVFQLVVDDPCIGEPCGCVDEHARRQQDVVHGGRSTLWSWWTRETTTHKWRLI